MSRDLPGRQESAGWVGGANRIFCYGQGGKEPLCGWEPGLGAVGGGSCGPTPVLDALILTAAAGWRVPGFKLQVIHRIPEYEVTPYLVKYASQLQRTPNRAKMDSGFILRIGSWGSPIDALQGHTL